MVGNRDELGLRLCRHGRCNEKREENQDSLSRHLPIIPCYFECGGDLATQFVVRAAAMQTRGARRRLAQSPRHQTQKT